VVHFSPEVGNLDRRLEEGVHLVHHNATKARVELTRVELTRVER